MVKLLLWLVLFVLCWPLALAALVLYPLVWLVLLPFRVLGLAVEGILELLRALFLLPSRALRALARVRLREIPVALTDPKRGRHPCANP